MNDQVNFPLNWIRYSGITQKYPCVFFGSDAEFVIDSFGVVMFSHFPNSSILEVFYLSTEQV